MKWNLCAKKHLYDVKIGNEIAKKDLLGKF